MALFQNPDDVEAAIAELSLNGFTAKDVSVVIFSANPRKPIAGSGLAGWLSRGGFLGDTIDRSDGISMMDGIGVGAVIGCLLGVVFGSEWRYGPVATGTGGLMLGGLIGYVCDRLIPEKRRDELETSLIDGLILMTVTTVLSSRADAAKGLLEANQAKQIAVLPESDSTSS